MQLSLPLKTSQRLGAALGLVLLLTTLITGLAVALSHRLDADLTQLDERSLPSVRLVHELGLLVEGQRGMAALHLLPHRSSERAALEARLLATRQRIEQRMAGYATRVAGPVDRQHYDTVKASLAAFWVAQDRLLSASRLAAADPTQHPASAALAHARSLLTGESQHAFLQLGTDLDAWWAFHEQASHHLAQQAHAAVRQAAVMLPGLCAVALLLGAVAWRVERQTRPSGGTVDAGLAGPPGQPDQPDQPDQRTGPQQAASQAILAARGQALPAASASAATGAAATPPPQPQPTPR